MTTVPVAGWLRPRSELRSATAPAWLASRRLTAALVAVLGVLLLIIAAQVQAMVRTPDAELPSCVRLAKSSTWIVDGVPKVHGLTTASGVVRHGKCVEAS